MPDAALRPSRLVGVAAVGVCVVLTTVLLPLAGAGGLASTLLAGAVLVVVGLVWLGEPSRGACLGAAALVATAALGSRDASSVEWQQSVALLWPPLAGGLLAGSLLVGRSQLLAVVAGVLAGPVRMLVFDPFLDPDCVRCDHQVLLFSAHNDVADALAWAGGALIVLALLRGIRAARHPLLRAAAGLVAVSTGPSWDGMPSPGPAVALGVLAIATGALDVADQVGQRRRLGRLASALRAGGSTQSALRELLSDPDLRVDYATERTASGPPGFIDRDGLPSGMPAAANTIEVGRPGAPVARIHPGARPRTRSLPDVLTPEIRLGLELERVSATLAAQARALAASRERLLQRGDEERRALERDLHDGAQQSLLALGFDLQVALAAPTTGDADREALEACRAEVRAALDELRDLSHGLYPPLLDTSGLRPALTALARRSDTPLSVEGDWGRRPPLAVERACYLVVADLARRSARPLRVRARIRSGSIDSFVMEVIGSDVMPDPVLIERVSALGGNVVVAARARPETSGRPQGSGEGGDGGRPLEGGGSGGAGRFAESGRSGEPGVHGTEDGVIEVALPCG